MLTIPFWKLTMLFSEFLKFFEMADHGHLISDVVGNWRNFKDT